MNSSDSFIKREDFIMNKLVLAYYRVYQWIFNIGAHFLHWRRPIQVSGIGSAGKIPDIL